MPMLDYSKLAHAKEKHRASHSVKNSFYIQKGNGKALSYRGNYKGDYAVFDATHPKLNLYYSSHNTK